MSEDKEEKHSHPIYISAGMAAAGMGRKPPRSEEKNDSSEEKIPAAEKPEQTPPSEDPVSDEPTSQPEIQEEDTSPESLEEKPVGEDIEEESYITEIHVEEDEVAAPAEPRPEDQRKVALLGRESESALEEIFSNIAGIEVTTPGEFDEFLQFIGTEKPELVVVATPGNGDHHELVKAALDLGAHVFCTAPFTRTLKEADGLVALAESKALTLSVGNALVCHPVVLAALKNRENLIGDLLEIRVYGEMDAHSGGEDLLTNGALLFDIVRMFAGDAEWCSAEITQRGERALGENIFHSRESSLGQLLGDRIYARFGMSSGVYVNFVSDQRAKQISGPGGIEFIGSKSAMRLHVSGDSPPALSVLQNPDSHNPDREKKWTEWDKADSEDGSSPLDDWLSAVESSSEPTCSGLSASKSLEMVHGVWQAGLSGKRTYFPLVSRLHPLNEEML